MLRSILALAALFAASPVSAQSLTQDETAKVDALVAKTLADTGVPSASIAIVRDGRIVLSKAYGKASEALTTATPDLRYQIASNSKQFTAMGLLLLEDEGKLNLDDHVSKWLPGISGGDSITIRQLLSHTSGLQDFWPQDYMFSAMAKPVTPQGIVDRWGKKPLDYAPGTRWQYSNTGYVVAGMILEKAAGEPLMHFLKRRIFDPLVMHPVDIDDSNGPGFPQGYHRYALGPVRVAVPPARGWLWAAGELSMSASDLAKWDIARLDRKLVPTDDWAAQEAPAIRSDGTTNGYGLGVSNKLVRGRRIIDHGGESVGFLSQNSVYPDSRAAIVVLTNADFSGATDTITEGIEKIVLPSPAVTPVNEATRADDVRAMVAAFTAGTIDPKSLTDNANFYFTPEVLGDYRASLSRLGPLTDLTPAGPPRLRGGFVNRNFTLKFGDKSLTLISYAEAGPHGRWEQFIVMPE
ncbi:MAG: serine hydrolase domain-containing protein [Sphingomicrobium sp.]